MKLVINRCYGGFGLSHAAVMEYARRSGFELFAFVTGEAGPGGNRDRKFVPYDPVAMKGRYSLINYSKKPLTADGKYEEGAYFSTYDIERDDPALVATVEALGDEASGDCSELKVIEIPDGVQWSLDEYDGIESVHEEHRS